MITKSGGNTFKGTAGLRVPTAPLEQRQHLQQDGVRAEWAAATYTTCPNKECKTTGGTPVQAEVGQFDGSFGGPIRKDQVWFFGSFRRSAVETSISRNSKNKARYLEFYPDADAVPQQINRLQPPP